MIFIYTLSRAERYEFSVHLIVLGYSKLKFLHLDVHSEKLKHNLKGMFLSITENIISETMCQSGLQADVYTDCTVMFSKIAFFILTRLFTIMSQPKKGYFLENWGDHPNISFQLIIG